MMVRIKRLSLTALVVAVIFSAVNACAQDADEAFALLKEGNARFITMKMWHPNINIERRADASVKTQKPLAIVLACSDSRVPVEAIFDRGIGDIFVVRVAGNIATDPSVIGSIEYGVGHLNSPLLVIMGHTDCGAVKAAISGPPLDGDIRAIQKTIEVVAARVKKDQPALRGDGLTSAVVKENVLQAKADLLSGSEMIKRMAGEGTLKVVPALYDLKTGAVDWFTQEMPATRQEEELVEEEIWALEDAYFRNLYKADYDAMLAMVHSQFLGWPSAVPQPIDKEGSKRFMKELIPKPTLCTFKIERGGIRMLGDVALTQYTIHVNCSDAASEVKTQSSRITHTWTKESGRWKLLGGMSY